MIENEARFVGALLMVVCLVGVTTPATPQTPGGDRPASAERYFPAGVFDNFTARWYAQTLTALEEPSLFELRTDKAVQVYRFLWLPSFHRPISVRLTIDPDGSGAIVARSVDEHAGLLTTSNAPHDSGKLILDAAGAASNAQVQDVVKQLQALEFWSMKTEDHGISYEDAEGRFHFTTAGNDGARWVLEGVKDGEHHVVDRWSPESTEDSVAKSREYARLCRYFLELGKVNVQGKDVY